MCTVMSTEWTLEILGHVSYVLGFTFQLFKCSLCFFTSGFQTAIPFILEQTLRVPLRKSGVFKLAYYLVLTVCIIHT